METKHGACTCLLILDLSKKNLAISSVKECCNGNCKGGGVYQQNKARGNAITYQQHLLWLLFFWGLNRLMEKGGTTNIEVKPIHCRNTILPPSDSPYITHCAPYSKVVQICNNILNNFQYRSNIFNK